MTEREQLEKVLERYTGMGIYRPHEVRILVEAARKHLDTLPKPLWRVTATLPYSGDAAAPYVATSHKEALDFARSYLEDGMTRVSVRQVPA